MRIVYICFDKKSPGSDIENENTSNKELGEELRKPIIIRKFKKQKRILTFCRQYLGC